MTRLHRQVSKILLCLILVVSTVAFWARPGRPVFAAPSRLDCQTVGITAPAEGSMLSGTVLVRGQGLVTNFQFYKVEYSPEEREKWTLIGTDVVRNPVRDGLLVTWPTDQVPEGTYRLRLRAVDVTGNYCEVVVSSLNVSRTPPTLEPTLVLTETPVLTAVPPQPTPTVFFKPTVEVGPILSQPGPIPTRSSPIDLPEVNTSGLVAFFAFGVLVMLAVLISAGLVLFLRRWG